MRWEELPKEKKNQIKNELLKATEALQNIEDILKSELELNLPKENLVIPEEIRIHLPKGYIRTVKTIEDEYCLKRLIEDDTLRKNIAYAIQFTDFLNYLFNRFSLGIDAITVGKEFRKISVIYIITIVEAFLAGIIEKFITTCFECQKFGNCTQELAQYLKLHEKEFRKIYEGSKYLSFSESIEFIKEMKISKQEYVKRLENFKTFYRNRIHIQYINRSSGERPWDYKEEYSTSLYNKAIEILLETREVIKELDEEVKINCFIEFSSE